MALSTFIRVARYAINDADKRKSKLRPTEEDLKFRPKLGDNVLINSLLENEGLKKLFSQNRTQEWVAKDKIRDLYLSFLKTDTYKDYLHKPSDQHADQQILLALFKHLSGNENYNEIIEDFNALWQDDKSLIIGAIKKIIKSLPAPDDFYERFAIDEDTVEEFGKELLVDVLEQQQRYLEIIEPALNNWDVERVAIIDMILIKMGLSEFINFESIPTKVTLNEFVDLAKIYSTDKSKEFVNGILDRLLKKLEKEGAIVKEGRGLIG
ncbi:MAG TPA: transcription antitermination factor NusB [Saprospiraceae bacterium]|nr:transcription antitermination factor NusB [Saprospiraceae bacterium]